MRSAEGLRQGQPDVCEVLESHLTSSQVVDARNLEIPVKAFDGARLALFGHMGEVIGEIQRGRQGRQRL